MSALSFRNSGVIFYGPHPCENCGQTICKAGDEFGGSSFTYPKGPIYPNTEWHPHFCNQADVREQRGKEAQSTLVGAKNFRYAVPLKWGDGFVISGDGTRDLIISMNQTVYDTQWEAWSGALERFMKNYPTWSLTKE